MKSRGKKQKANKEHCPGIGFQIEDWKNWDEEIHQAACVFREWYGRYPNTVFCSPSTRKRLQKAFWSTVHPASEGIDPSTTGEVPEEDKFHFYTPDYTLSFWEENSLPQDSLVILYDPDD